MVKPDQVSIMFEGRIVKEGGPELVGVLEEKGYGWIREEVGAARPRDAIAARTTFPIERVREQFPMLAREIDGVPVAYLDSGATSRAGAGLDRGGRRLRASPPLQRPPRRPTRSRPRRPSSTRGRGRRSPATSAPPTAAR